MSILSSEYTTNGNIIARVAHNSNSGFLDTGRSRTHITISDAELASMASSLGISAEDINLIFMIFKLETDSSKIKLVKLSKFGSKSGYEGVLDGDSTDVTLVAYEEDIRLVLEDNGTSHLLYNGINLTLPEKFAFLQEDENGDIDPSEITSWAQKAKMMSDSPSSNDSFGYSVSVSGDTVALGSPTKGTGSVYIFIKSGSNWILQDVLTPSDGESGDAFGWAVDIEGNVVVVGAKDDTNTINRTGSLYVFNRSGVTWTQVQKIEPEVLIDYGDQFGCSIALDGNLLVAGARGANLAEVWKTNDSGVSWSKVANLPKYGPEEQNALYGYSVDIDGDLIVVGAPESDIGGSSKGRAYVYKTTDGGNNWNKTTELYATNTKNFGEGVAIDGNLIVVGAPATVGGGSAYVFKTSDGGSNWSETEKLVASDGEIGIAFGSSVDIFESTIAVGSIHAKAEGVGAGAVYMFGTSDGGDNWSETEKIVASDPTMWGEFGISVKIDFNRLVVGDYRNNVNNYGASYLFDLPDVF